MNACYRDGEGREGEFPTQQLVCDGGTHVRSLMERDFIVALGGLNASIPHVLAHYLLSVRGVGAAGAGATMCRAY